MKNFLIISFIFLIQMSFSQKKYHLDYALEFESTNGSVVNKNIFYYNSQNNGIRMFLFETDSVNYDFTFSDSKNISIKSTIKKDELLKAKYIQNTCEFIYRYKDRFEKKLKKYSFINLNDTVINGISYYHYVAKNNTLKRKDKNVHYIVDKNSTGYMPFFQNAVTFELWKKQQIVPYGIPFMIFSKDYYGEITNKMQLKNHYKIDKNIVIPDDCKLD